jgi:Carboxypeptidase regulatory-like domain
MKRKRRQLAMIFVGLLLIQTASRAEVFCGKVRRLKPVQCVCGKIMDPTGGPLSGVTVTVIKDGIDVATLETDGTGSFVFGELKSGNYELSAHLDGFFLPFRSAVVVANSTKPCRRGLVIMLVGPYPDNCGSYVVGIKRMVLSRNSN